MDIRTIPIEQLTPAEYNPRKVLRPQDPAYRKLEASLREFGLVEPLVWNEASGRVVGGHARLAILRRQGVREVPVSVVHLSPQREKALNVVLNNREAQGRFDPQKLADLLEELSDLPELSLTGFDAATLSTLRLEPAEGVTEPAEAGLVCIRLEVSEEVYAQLTEPLERLLNEFDIACHVTRR